MYLSLGQAAKETGKSKATISKYLKTGKLSYVDKDDNGYQIDPAELFRVFPPVKQVNGTPEQPKTPNVNPDLLLQNKELEVKLQAAQELIEILKSDKEDYKSRLDKIGAERHSLSLMIADMRKEEDKTDEHQKSFLGRLFGK